MVRITGVEAGSPAARAKIQAGDLLVAIGDEPITDVLDYRFFMMERRLTLSLMRGDTPYSVKIRKGEYDDLGLEFESYLMDRQRSCKNHCIFCFIDQNPKGMRKSIYFKDDDDRLSFLFGNYITLTNLTDHDVERILRMHISPVNVSVHTTDPALRERMMRNPEAGSSLEKLRRLVDGGAQINTQLVLCPGYNDGAALERTLRDLGGMYPAVQSIACVPVGLTEHRRGLAELRPFTPDEAGETIDCIERFSSRWLEQYGERIAYPADEFFLKAGREIPDAEYYGDFAQLENGVGLLALCRQEFFDALEEAEPSGEPRRYTVATGEAAAPMLSSLCEAAMRRDPALSVEVVPVKNRFFGGHITVTGLVTGSDLVAALKGRELGGALLISSAMLRHEQDLFLDDMSPAELSEALGVDVAVIEDGRELSCFLFWKKTSLSFKKGRAKEL